MATPRWLQLTNPRYLSDDELENISSAASLLVTLSPVDITGIPAHVTYCQVIGVLHRIRLLCNYFTYALEWLDIVEDRVEIDWNVADRPYERHEWNSAVLAQATAMTHPHVYREPGPPRAGQLSREWRRHLRHNLSDFMRINLGYFAHTTTTIHVVQVFERVGKIKFNAVYNILTHRGSQRAWGIRFLVEGNINGEQRSNITVNALEHLSLDLSTAVPAIRRARSMRELGSDYY
ncbi:uncharacterized protein B0H18DRAFT_959992 [Fomitopsis serialis]|uniref:uncharacterized protein n=1 Tax=Fomitopsis serialis TaxID=139415 RepID=UPI0020084A5E|nr:uncharacterized protein B0H18DRAFT_960046 [Neoantrodia serialis]XP_047886404.1 uncharacterized protein B0H18DRAFT_959992 [Neoantrodia serialis]KAH9914042.1 hypothetical protein B0H18DRAFT_960046 [Neoantrodia serialis]KAH9914212.1 hypothetical protein B0H18DRAFT_959992 [Neoantrodia serialis]